MARSASATQITDLARTDRKVLLRVRVEDSAATLQNMTTFDGTDWVDQVEVMADQDSRAISASIVFWREKNGNSIAPLMSSSSANSGGALIAPARQAYVDIAVIAPGVSVTSPDWVTLFYGWIDEWDAGGNAPKVSIPLRDIGGLLADLHIESEALYGDSGTPEDQEDVLQEIYDDVSGAITLVTPSSPVFGIVEYTQRRMSLDAATQDLVDQNGWDVKAFFNGNSPELRLYEPDRSKTVPDLTLTNDDYYSITTLKKSSKNVRNVVEMIFTDTDGSVQSYVGEDAASIAEFRRRYMLLDYRDSPHITGTSAASALVAQVLGDTAQPLAEMAAELRFNWRIELGDLLRFPSNGQHFDTNTDLAVTGYRHILTNSVGVPSTTSVSLRAKPSGGTMRWLHKETISRTKQEVVDTRILTEQLSIGAAPSGTITPTLNLTTGEASAVFWGNGAVQSWKYAVAVGSVPSDATVDGETAVNGNYLTEATVGVLETLDPGETLYIKATTFRATGGNGEQGSYIVGYIYRSVAGGPAGVLTLLITSDGDVDLLLSGNEQVASWKYLVQTGSVPSDAAVRAEAAVNGTRIQTAGPLLSSVSPDTEIYAGAFPYDAASGGGTEGERVDTARKFGVGVDGIPDDALTPAKLTETNKKWSYSTLGTVGRIINTGPSNKYGWNGGTLNVSGTTYTIPSQVATLTVSNDAYVYWDPDVSTTAFQTTASYSDIIGDRKILIATLYQSDGGYEPNVIEQVGFLGLTETYLHANAGHVNLLQANTVATTNVIAENITVDKLDALSGGGLSIDFGASGASACLSHTNFELLANGNANFSGDISGASGTFGGTVSATSFTGTNANFSGGYVQAGGFRTADVTAPAHNDEIVCGNIFASTASGNSGEIGGARLSISGAVVELLGIPTSNPGGSGRVWSNGGVLNIT